MLSYPMVREVTIMGAGGKMGCRITDQLKEDKTYDMHYVEPSDVGQERLAERGLEAEPASEALPGSDTVIMAVPDELIGTITEEIVPRLDEGTLVVLLDPAAAYAGEMQLREDLSYFLAHPAHPSFETAETRISDDETDWFGGQGRDEQDIICALHHGPEESYEEGVAIAEDFYAPVRHTHRLTTEQMALLEPALVETLQATCIDVIQEGLEEVVDRGVPEEAAREFLLGHFRIEFGIIFGFTDFPLSDGAQEAVEEAKKDIFKSNWKETVFDQENLEESTQRIATPE